jgi:hypothetical protein
LGFLAIIIIMLLRLLMAILPLRQWFVLILILVAERFLNCRHHSVSATTSTDVAATSGG